MGVFRRIRAVFGPRMPGPGITPVHIADPRFDNWESVREFADVRTARAWHQALSETGIETVLTADWPLDRYGHGEIYLCVQGDDWSEAELLLSNLDLDIDLDD
jgi:hypothetical protein